ncbi:MFS transporter [Cupriavidus agavae]|uniref:Putative MFS family arabinose efflux permease n=1 Tax=Cupriavidus agavae TaxID=1001822 RepID=A0A4Q7R890_9BURK|nr:MFS transporter [Cupriavidus agavae]RZT29065.1 putative MFS family arabinose efflux permease [Cupriavidus agavae]
MPKNGTGTLAFAGATVSLAAMFAASASPIPLYETYRESNGIGYTDLSLTAVAYFAGTVSALLLLGRLSNHVGRRPVTLAALGLCAIACLMLLNVSSAIPLIVARLLLGLACGLASSATAAYAMDSAPRSPHWLGAAVASNGPLLGLTAGVLGSGALVEYAPMPRTLPYLFALAGLALGAALVAFSGETASRTPGALGSLRPRFRLPARARKEFAIAACTFVATWALGGFYQAFGPSIAAQQLGSSHAIVAALVVAALMAPSALGSAWASRFPATTVQRAGMLTFFLAVLGLLASLRLRAVTPFIAASAVAGVALGATLTGGIRSLVSEAPMGERAGLLALIYATSYCGAAVPSFVAGQLARGLSLFQIAIGDALLAGVACAIVFRATGGAARSPRLNASPVRSGGDHG